MHNLMWHYFGEENMASGKQLVLLGFLQPLNKNV